MKKITLLLMLFVGFSAFAQFPQDFEGTFPPDGWQVFRGVNDLGVESDWTSTTVGAATGEQAAYVEYEALGDGELAEDWLVSPAYTVTAPNTFLAFYQGQDYEDVYGSTYTVRVSTTSQTDISSFTIVDTQTEEDFGVDMTSKKIDLSAYIGQTIYIAFVMENNDGDSWVIDGVDFISNISAPDCVSNPVPANEATVPVGETTFSWSVPSSGSAPTFYTILSGSTPDAVTDFVASTTTPSIDLYLSNYSTTFYWKVISVNLAGESIECPVWSFSTQSPPGYCLIGSQYPDGNYVIETCDGVTENEIVPDGYAGEYSVVEVTAGNTYTFTSGETDFITISNEAGDTSIITGTTPLTWDATLTGAVRFYSHTDDQCGEEQAGRIRAVVCSEALSTKGFDNAAFNAFPNPVRNILNISYSKDISKVTVFNMLGQEVSVKSSSSNLSKIDMSNLSRGSYLVKVIAGGSTKTIKVFKQ